MIEDLSPFYATGPFGLAESCALGDSVEFPGHLHTVDESAWGLVSASTHTLRYQSATLLSAGDLVTVAGHVYKVIGIPRAINALEHVASLVLQP